MLAQFLDANFLSILFVALVFLTLGVHVGNWFWNPYRRLFELAETERDQAVGALESLRGQTKTHAEAREQLAAQLEQLQDANAQLDQSQREGQELAEAAQRAYQELEVQLSAERKRTSKLSAELKDATQQLGKLSQESDERQHLEAECSRLADRLETRESELAAAVARQAELEADCARLSAATDTPNAADSAQHLEQLTELNEQLDDATRKLEQLTEEHAELTGRLAEAEAAVQARAGLEHTLEERETQLAELRAAAAQQAEQQQEFAAQLAARQSECEQLREQAAPLQQQLAALEDALAASSAHNQQLTADLADRQQRLDQAEQQLRAAHKEGQRVESHRAKVAGRLRRERARRAELTGQLATLSQEVAAFQARSHLLAENQTGRQQIADHAQEHLAQLQETAAEHAAARGALVAREAELAQLQNRLETLHAAQRTLVEQRDHALTAIQQLKQERDELLLVQAEDKRRLAALEHVQQQQASRGPDNQLVARIQQLEAEKDSLDGMLKATSERYQSLRKQAADQQEVVDHQTRQVTELRLTIQKQADTNLRMKQESREIDQRLQAERRQRAELETQYQQLAEQHAELLDQQRASERAQEQLEQWRERVMDLSSQLERLQAEGQAAGAQRDQLQHTLEDLNRELRETRAAKAQAELAHAQFRSGIDQERQQHQQALEQLELQAEELQQLHRQRQALESELEKLSGRLAEFQRDLSQRAEELSRARGEQQRLTRELGEERERRTSLERSFLKTERALAELRASSLSLQQQQSAMQTSMQQSHDNLRQIAGERERTLRQLHDQAQPPAAPPPPAQREGPPAAADAARRQPPFDPRITRQHPRRGIVYTERPEQWDDLKLIRGVAEVLERKLNEAGVYTYRQIIEWDEVAIDEFSHVLSFRNRITRDNWQGQAQRLYREKYGRRERPEAA